MQLMVASSYVYICMHIWFAALWCHQILTECTPTLCHKVLHVDEAWKHRGRYCLQDAQDAFQQALEVDPTNRAASVGQAECNDRMRICQEYNQHRGDLATYTQ